MLGDEKEKKEAQHRLTDSVRTDFRTRSRKRQALVVDLMMHLHLHLQSSIHTCLLGIA